MTKIDLRNIVYDQTSALAEVERVRKEQPLENRKNRIWNTCLFILIFICGLGAITFVAYYFIVQRAIFGNYQVLPMMLCVGIGLWFGFGIWSEVSRPVLPEYEWYSLNAQYYLLTHKYHVLECTLNYQYDGMHIVHLDLEDANHVVHHDCICFPKVKKVTRTDIAHPTLNLLDEKLYVPYST